MRVLTSILVLLSWSWTTVQAQEEDYPPGTFQLTPQVDLGLESVAVEVPEQFEKLLPSGLEVKLPSGFSAQVYAAAGLRGPRFMAWSPDGVLHVANMKAGDAGQFDPASDHSSGQIVALPDRDRDGVADTALVVADGLWWAHSLGFYQGAMYVADTDKLLRFRDGDGDGIYEERQQVAPLPRAREGEREHHITRTLLIDQRTGKFYVAVGSTCDLCREVDPERAAILEMNADGSGRRVFARGLRNAVGLALHPQTGQLWADHNGHDREGRSLPPEWISIIREEGFYGWPLAYGYQVYTDFSVPEYQRALFPLTHQDTLEVQSMRRPVALWEAHLAPMAIHFYTGDSFPPEYKNAALVAFRGGSNAAVPGFKVGALFVNPDGTQARRADFLTGFKGADGQVWGAPVGLAEDGTGNLYVGSDWYNHFILKVRPGKLQGQWEHSLPDSAFAGDSFRVRATVRLTRTDPQGERPVVVADLSSLGGPEALPLEAEDELTYHLDFALPLPAVPGRRRFGVRVSQQLPGDLLQIRLSHELVILPGEDLQVMGEGLGEGWQVLGNGGAVADFGGAQVYAGKTALGAQVKAENALRGWNVDLLPGTPMEITGYGALRFAFHPGSAQLPERGEVFSVALRPGKTLNLLKEKLVDMALRQWQVVEIPLERFELKSPVEAIRFAGNLEGTFYLDQIQLVASAVRPPTAVGEERQAVLPAGVTLAPNFPNPFNAQTVIPFELPAAGPVELAIYDLAGQQVAVLASGAREAGGYRVYWDGRDQQGHPLASGVYLYRLRAGQKSESRKLVLLR
ncbi:MAG: PQQ-dependent sugar dehydrogenase [Candidatus Latescibacteria bacterium]|nr:PQQ-dependent sugar dehydrogenase [Candidatus Latescibacterota bacterium]